jgi:hypothetical protein
MRSLLLLLALLLLLGRDDWICCLVVEVEVKFDFFLVFEKDDGGRRLR